jgi:hypothetical protein
MWIGFTWLRIGTSGGLFCTGIWNLEFHKKREIS